MCNTTAVLAPGHPWFSRLNTWFFDYCSGYVNRVTRPHKQQAFGHTTDETIVELGTGAGANFGYLPKSS